MPGRNGLKARAGLLAGLVLLGLGLAAPAEAGGSYVPPVLKPAETVTPEAAMLADLSAFAKALRAGDAAGVAAGLAPVIETVGASLDLAGGRGRDKVGPVKDKTDLLVLLGNHTGGDWDVPPGADLTTFLLKMERDFILQSLAEGEWGRDPMVKGAVCTYAYRDFDPKAVARAAKALGVEGSSFVFVDTAVTLLASPDAKAVKAAELQPDRLYARDYDTETPQGWTAFHLPDGGTGFVADTAVTTQSPNVSGLCFRKGQDGHWVLAAQVSTGL